MPDPFAAGPKDAHDGPITRLVDRVAKRQAHRDQMYVRGDARMVNRTVAMSGVRFVVVMAAVYLATADAAPGAWLWVLVLTVFAVYGIRESLVRAMRYRDGWITGRQELRAAMAEAQRRGLDDDEWLASEIAREANVIW